MSDGRSVARQFQSKSRKTTLNLTSGADKSGRQKPQKAPGCTQPPATHPIPAPRSRGLGRAEPPGRSQPASHTCRLSGRGLRSCVSTRPLDLAGGLLGTHSPRRIQGPNWSSREGFRVVRYPLPAPPRSSVHVNLAWASPGPRCTAGHKGKPRVRGATRGLVIPQVSPRQPEAWPRESRAPGSAAQDAQRGAGLRSPREWDPGGAGRSAARGLPKARDSSQCWGLCPPGAGQGEQGSARVAPQVGRDP